MRLAKTDIIADLEAPVVRDLMRRLHRRSNLDDIGSRLPAGVGAAEVADQLVAAGFLELEQLRHLEGDSWWKTTIKGNALAMDSFGKPITRPTAERLLGGLIGRAATWNADQGRVISVERLVVFGSYLDPSTERLGDLDIAATLTHWPPHADPTDWSRRCEDHLQASGCSFSSLVDQLCWPEDEAQMMLRNRSAAIHITIEDIRNLTTRCAVVYTRGTPGVVRLHPP